MPKETTYSHARENLAALWDEVIANQETVIIHRRGSKDVALVDAGELRSLMETAYLLRSPKNAERLLSALSRALNNESESMSVDQLRQQMKLVERMADDAGAVIDAKAS